MALLPSGYIYSTTNNHGVASERISAVAIGLSSATPTTAGNVFSRAFTVQNQALPKGRNQPIQKSSAGSYNATGCITGPNFAYNQPSTEWTVLRMGTKINGTASNLLLNPASGSTMARRNIKQRAFGAMTSSAFRANRFQWTDIAGQRSPWTSQPSGMSGAFPATTGNSANADDHGIFASYMAVPGELVYIQDGKTVKLDDYKARTGN